MEIFRFNYWARSATTKQILLTRYYCNNKKAHWAFDENDKFLWIPDKVVQLSPAYAVCFQEKIVLSSNVRWRLKKKMKENPRWLYCGRHPAQVPAVAGEGRQQQVGSNFFQTDSGGCRYILFKKRINSVYGAPQFSEVFIPVRFGRLIRSRSGSKAGLHMHLHR